jgi:hypothetical protein
VTVKLSHVLRRTVLILRSFAQMICALTGKRFFIRLSATIVILRNRCEQHARGGLVLDQAVTDDIDRVGVALAPEGRDGAADIIQNVRRNRNPDTIPVQDSGLSISVKIWG